MKGFTKSLIALAMLVAGSNAVASTGGKHDELKRFVGKWNCNAKTADGKTWEATFEFKSLLGGKAVMENYSEKASKDHPAKDLFSTNGIWGFDANSGKFTGYNVAGDGSVNTRTSSGWTGDIWTWEVGDGLKFNFTEKGGKELTCGVDVKGKDGTWANVNNLTCKK